MNDTSTQQEQILDIIEELGKEATPTNILKKYKEKYETEFSGNLYEQLNRLKAKNYLILDNKIYKNKRQRKFKNVTRLTDDEIQEIKEYINDDKLLDKIGADFNPYLINMAKEKLLAFLVIASEQDSNGDKNRTHMLLEGEPSSGKSTLIETAYANYGGIFVDPTTSKAGLIGTVKGSIYTEGALAQADQGTIYIDELDKFSYNDQTGLLQALETGKIRLNKDGVHKEINARVRCIATCNNLQKIIEPLRSRFDIIKKLPKFDLQDEGEILSNQFQEWGQPKQNKKDIEFFKKYLEATINYKTQLPPPETTEREKLRATYLSEATNQTSPLFNKTTRQKTTPIRLAHTIAKAKQHETIQLEDLKDAIELIR